MLHHHSEQQTVVTSHKQTIKQHVIGTSTPVTQVNLATTALASIENTAHQPLGCEFKMMSAWYFVDTPSNIILQRRFHASAQCDNYVYVFGGETKQKVSAKLDSEPVKQILHDLLRYDINTNDWTILDQGSVDSPPPRKGASLQCHNGNLFLFGGAGPGICYNDLWMWDVQESAWTELTLSAILTTSATAADDIVAVQKILQKTSDKTHGAEAAQQIASIEPMVCPAGRAYHVAGIYQNTMIIYGGYGFKNEASTLWLYDIPGGCWKNIRMVSMLSTADGIRPAHPGLRFGLVACVRGSDFFIFSGQQQTKLVGSVLYRLDLQTHMWQQIATTGSPPAHRTYATGCLVGKNRWFIHGGSSADDVFADSHELDLEQLHWHSSTSLFSNVTLEGHTSASITSSSNVTSVLLLGGATSGPYVPKGPLMQCDFILPSLKDFLENIRLEDCVIRPTEASKLLWSFLRQEQKSTTNSIEISKYNKLVTEYEETLVKVKTLEKVEKDVESLKSANEHLTRQLQELTVRHDEALKKLTEISDQQVPSPQRPSKGKVTPKASVSRETIREALIEELRVLEHYITEQTFSELAVTNTRKLITSVEEVMELLREEAIRYQSGEGRISPAPLIKKTKVPVEGVGVKTTSIVEDTSSVSKKAGAERYSVQGISVGVSSYDDPVLEKLNLTKRGTALDRKNSVRSSRSRRLTADASCAGQQQGILAAPVGVPGINCAAQCGSGSLRLQAGLNSSTKSPTSRSASLLGGGGTRVKPSTSATSRANSPPSTRLTTANKSTSRATDVHVV